MSQRETEPGGTLWHVETTLLAGNEMCEKRQPRAMPEINVAICNLCGLCVAKCPHGAASIVGRQIVLNDERCAYCGDCEAICPLGAITLPYDIVVSYSNDAAGG